ncbi:MAG: BTAD domain-containing putative transcriptional regulator [Pseudonocardia sp.]
MVPAHLRVSVLGSFTLTDDGTTVPLGVDARRLVAYLAVHHRAQRRAALAADLWPGIDAGAGARLLDDAVAAVDVPGLLDESADGSLALAADVKVDLAEAMALVRALPDVPLRGSDAAATPRPDLSLLSADILPGWTAAWIAVERERFRQLRLHALEEFSLRCSAAGRYADAVAVAESAVRSAPSRESARRALIEAHLAEGEVAAAVAAYDAYQELLRSSVGPAATSLEGMLPPSPAWPVLRVRRPVQRASAQLVPGRRVRGGGSTRRLVSGGSASR